MITTLTGAWAQDVSAWPAHVFAPYVDATLWPTPPIHDIAHQTGVRFFTLGFITANVSGDPAWGGQIAWNADHYQHDIALLRQDGGNVIVSFGGAAGTELALASQNVDVATLQGKYQAVINEYQVDWVDFDIEGTALADSASVNRRNQAISGLQVANLNLKVAYTLPVSPLGLTANGVALLQNAVSQGVRIDLVNIMAMDYYDGTTPDMGQYAINAANGVFQQLKTLFPVKTDAHIWAMIGITPMIGQNDDPLEIFSLADAQQLLEFAQQKQINLIAMWSISRDNGDCPGRTSADPTCSGMTQDDFAFSNIFKTFSGSDTYLLWAK